MKKKKTNTLFSICLIICLLSGLMAFRCEKESTDCHKSIKASNDSDKAIYIADYGDFDPDGYAEGSPIHRTVRVNPGDQNIKIMGFRGECFELLYEYDPTPRDFIVFDAEVIENTPWIEVRKQQLYLKKYENITLDTLRKWNWTVVYP